MGSRCASTAPAAQSSGVSTSRTPRSRKKARTRSMISARCRNRAGVADGSWSPGLRDTLNIGARFRVHPDDVTDVDEGRYADLGAGFQLRLLEDVGRGVAARGRLAVGHFEVHVLGRVEGDGLLAPEHD